MFSKSHQIGKLVCLLISLAFLSACGNSEDADKIKDILEINDLNVTALQISSNTNETIFEAGTTEQFIATAIIDNGNGTPIDVTKKVRWSTSDPSIASINQNGLMTSNIVDGMVSIIARWADLNDSTDIMISSADLVSITIEGNTTPVSVCTSGHQLTAKGNFDDSTTRNITDDVSWSSADTSKLQIDQTGKLSSLGSGAVNVTATRNTITGNANISINDDLQSISISAPDDEVAVNGTLTFTATGTYSDVNSTTRNLTQIATWQSSDTTKLSISNTAGSKGIARGVAEGTSLISATCNSTTPVNSSQTTVTVTPEVVINKISINQDASSLEFKIIDSPEQLVARLKRSDGSFTTDVTDDDDTTWSIVRVVQGKGLNLSNTKGSKGEITFTEPGVTLVNVRYKDNDANIGPFNYELEIEIVE